MMARLKKVPTRVRTVALAALAAGGIAAVGFTGAALANPDHKVLHGRSPAAPSGPTWTGSSGSPRPPGAANTVLPDGSRGVIKAPPGFVPGAKPSGGTKLHGTPPSR